MPYGGEELLLVEHEPEHARKLLARHDGQQAPRRPRPAPRSPATCSAELGAVVDEPLHAPREAGQPLQRSSGSRVSTAKSGISPTIDRTLSGMLPAVGQVQDVVEEAVLPRPTG